MSESKIYKKFITKTFLKHTLATIFAFFIMLSSISIMNDISGTTQESSSTLRIIKILSSGLHDTLYLTPLIILLSCGSYFFLLRRHFDIINLTLLGCKPFNVFIIPTAIITTIGIMQFFIFDSLDVYLFKQIKQKTPINNSVDMSLTDTINGNLNVFNMNISQNNSDLFQINNAIVVIYNDSGKIIKTLYSKSGTFYNGNISLKDITEISNEKNTVTQQMVINTKITTDMILENLKSDRNAAEKKEISNYERIKYLFHFGNSELQNSSIDRIKIDLTLSMSKIIQLNIMLFAAILFCIRHARTLKPMNAIAQCTGLYCIAQLNIWFCESLAIKSSTIGCIMILTSQSFILSLLVALTARKK